MCTAKSLPNLCLVLGRINSEVYNGSHDDTELSANMKPDPVIIEKTGKCYAKHSENKCVYDGRKSPPSVTYIRQGPNMC